MLNDSLTLAQAARLIGVSPKKLEEVARTYSINLQAENIEPLEFTQLLTASRLKIKINRKKESLHFEFVSFLRREDETVYFLMVEPDEKSSCFEPFFLEIRISRESDNIFELLPIIKNILTEIEEFEPKLVKICYDKIEIIDIFPPELEF